MPIIAQSGINLLETGVGLNYPIIGWDNEILTTNIAASAAATGFPATNLANPSTHQMWRGVGTSTHTITHTPPPGATYNFAGIAGHNLGTKGWTVAVEVDIGSGYQTIVSGLPTTDAPLLFRWSEDDCNSLRLSLTGGSAAPQIGALFLGKLLIMERRIEAPHTPINLARTINAIAQRSQGGNYLGSIVIGEGRSSDIGFNNLTDTWFRANMLSFLTYASDRKPFFFAWMPVTFTDDVGYGWCRSDPRPSVHRANGMMQVSLDVDAIA